MMTEGSLFPLPMPKAAKLRLHMTAMAILPEKPIPWAAQSLIFTMF